MNSNGFLEKSRVALRKPLIKRCEEIKLLIEGTSTKDLHGFFPQLLGSIFGYGDSNDWGLQLYQVGSTEASALQAFLSPKGPIFKLVDKLQGDGYLRYEFFVHYLPRPTQSALTQGVIPTLYHNKVPAANTLGKTQNVVSLNAFEYFLFHFAYYMVYQHKSKETSGSESPYLRILEEYLHYFLPTDGSPIQTSGKCTPAAVNMARSSTWQDPSPYSRTHYQQSQFTGLIRAGHSGLANTQNLHYHGALDHSSEETWRSEVFVQVLAEFWLNQNSMESVRGNVLSHGQDYFMPSQDLVHMARMLVKHVHAFVHSNCLDNSHPALNPTDDLKRNIIPRLLQKNLYCFLRHGFAHWPLDHSFRVILETWLSYIQPWRYTKGPEGKRGELTPPAALQWKSFIMDNFLFYTTLFLEFISRSCRFDLRSVKDAHLLLRGTKVFSSQGLVEIIEEGEKLLVTHANAHPRSYSPGGVVAAASALRNHVTELEGPSYFYRPVFQRPGTDKIDELYSRVAIAHTEAHSDLEDRETLPSTGGLGEWIRSVLAGNFFDDDSDRRVQGRKLVSYLAQASQNLSHLNKGGRDMTDRGDKTIPWGSPTAPGRAASSPPYGLETPSAQATVPDYVETQRGLVPTPLGKYQMINGLRKFDVRYSGDPELQPIRSFENASLVRLLYKLSMGLNEKVGPTLERVCNKSAFFHSATCRLCPALKTTGQSAILRSPRTRVQSPHGVLCPRISLRFLASYRTWFYVLVFYLLCWLFSLDSLLLFFFLLTLLLSVMLLHNMTPAYQKDASYERKIL